MRDRATYDEKIDLLVASIDCLDATTRRILISTLIDNANRYNREGNQGMRRLLASLALLAAEIRDDADRYDRAFDEIVGCTRLEANLDDPESWE